MREMFFCATVDDVGMDGFSSPEHLRNLLDFWENEGLKGTMFVVPRCEGRELGGSPENIAVLKEAIGRLHEVAQHGLDHGRFQTGIPPKMVLDLPHEGPAREYLATHRAEIDAALTVEKLREVLAHGRRILETALGIDIAGFRAPCLSTCDALFEALAAENYAYDSSLVFQTKAWDLINNPDQRVTPLPITRKYFDEVRAASPLCTWPLTAEFTWYLKRAHFDAFLDLARHDFDDCLAAGIPFVSLSHVSPVQEGDPECGLDLYRELLAHARTRCDAAGIQLTAATLSELGARYFRKLRKRESV